MPLQKDIEKRCLFPFHVVSIEARHPELHVRVRSQAVCVPKWWSLDASPIRAEFGARTASPLCLLCRTVSRTVSHLLRGVFCPDRGGRRTAIMARSVPRASGSKRWPNRPSPFICSNLGEDTGYRSTRSVGNTRVFCGTCWDSGLYPGI